MRTKVQRWGNSLALRIPKSFATEVGLDSDDFVELTLVDGKLVIIPQKEMQYTLDELLAGITPDNLHGEVNTGPAVGAEVW